MEPDYKKMFEEKSATITKIWKILGIEKYEDAKGKSIYELVEDAVEKAWRYDDLSNS